VSFDVQETVVDFLVAAAARRPAHLAVEEVNGAAITYAALHGLSDRVRDHLEGLGIGRGDRVGVCMRKSIDAYAVMLGALKAGAAYVPMDRSAPAWRLAFISHDCDVKVLVLERALTSEWQAEAEPLGPVPKLLELDEVGGGAGLREALDRHPVGVSHRTARSEPLRGDDLAYILYTSGSTGTPKGVMLTHACATLHVNWFSEALSPHEDDRFSSHAPFHFDLSITDLFVPLKHGATVLLIDADAGKEPTGLAELIASRHLTIWYSTPTILTLLAEFGKMARHDYSALRLVLFAGEVFPVRHLRNVKRILPNARFFNLYGPTETNVCTWHPIPQVIEPDRTDPFPIGRPCSHFVVRVVDESGRNVERGVEGELIVSGIGMLKGYYNNPARTAEAFVIDADGRRWYRTGDIVIENDEGVFVFVGRRDRMVKRRGYRIELGDIEAGLYRHDGVREAAVVALRDTDGGVRIAAFIVVADDRRRSEIEMRSFCRQALPASMLPDVFRFLDVLPKTSTDKIDYQRLMQAD
jgi:amino acid adenylation domain-containing protein